MKSKILISAFALLFLFAGCNRQNRATDSGCRDDITEPEPITVAEPTEPPLSIPHRGWQERTAAYENVGLKHPALYLEGPYENKGSNDGYFKTWDGDSAISLVASPVIFVGHVIALPVRMVQTPPWKTQVSRSDYPAAEPAHAVRTEPSGRASKE